MDLTHIMVSPELWDILKTIGLGIIAGILTFIGRWLWRNISRLLLQIFHRPIYPIWIGKPVPREIFFGRRDQTKRFFDAVTAPEPHSMSILGVRRSGKTSFLKNHVGDPEVARHYVDTSKYLFPFIDLENGQVRSPISFYVAVNEAIKKELKRIPQELDEPPSSGSAVENLKMLVRFLGQNGIRLVLLLDEFERLTEEKPFTGKFFSQLVSFLGDGNACWVTATHRPVTVLSQNGTAPCAPFSTVFHLQPIYLGILEDDSCQEFIRKAFQAEELKFTDADATFIESLAGRLPFWIQVATDCYLQELKRKRHYDKADIIKSVSAEFDWAMEPHFQHYWKQFDNKERKLLNGLATKNHSRGSRQPDPDNYHLLNDLEHYGIVEQEGKEFKISSSAFARWIEKNVHSSRPPVNRHAHTEA